jgi:hypothetical protein
MSKSPNPATPQNIFFKKGSASGRGGRSSQFFTGEMDLEGIDPVEDDLGLPVFAMVLLFKKAAQGRDFVCYICAGKSFVTN